MPYETYRYVLLVWCRPIFVGRPICYASARQISDYSCTIEYHLGRANVMGDSLSKKSYGQLVSIWTVYIPLLTKLKNTYAIFDVDHQGALLAHFQVRPVLVDRVWEAQDPQCVQLKMEPSWYLVLDDAHISAHAMHTYSTKMYHIIKPSHYWWGMK